MARPVWPATVPHEPSSRSIVEPFRKGLESEMQAGNIRSRRTATVVLGVVDLTIRMTTAEFQTFKAFVRDTLSHGTAEFELPVSDLTGCTVRRVRLRNGGQYQPSRAGSRIFVSFSLDVWDL
ncbi:hypothetical protein [Microvirga lenta]|uniref:hypothetical protein n=1 Tax=Microvirga lenta TaxID=2881337 RepID=UPI001CFEE24D|nr:hypothetical protein [Microvirga lenta]MCB5173641.1 hypothetical protein [Microvirga lenta]